VPETSYLARKAAGAARATANIGPRRSILVVDGDSAVCRVIALMLQEVDGDVLSVPDGEAALELVAEKQPCMVIAEVRLAGMPGDELARRLRLCADPAMMVVLMSAYPRPPHGAEDEFLQKPLRFDRLIALAREAIGS
jgi:CheY-like chemotaxis protein